VDEDASFDLLAIFLGTQTILLLGFAFGGKGLDGCLDVDEDASFALLAVCLGTQTILLVGFAFGGVGLDSFVNVLCFDFDSLCPKV